MDAPKRQRVIFLVVGALLGFLGLWGWLSDIETPLTAWILGLRWYHASLLGGSAALGAGLGMLWSGRQSPPLLSAPAPSPLTMDPWTDVDLEEPILTPEYLHGFLHAAQHLEHQGQLPAAYEVYLQAYQLAHQRADTRSLAPGILLTLRKIEKRRQARKP